VAEVLSLQRPPTDRIGRALFVLARGFALAGGLVLLLLTLMSLASIAGRWLFSAPLPGDYELIQLGCAVAVATFLPLTQLRGGHVIVDFFTARSRPTVQRRLDALGALLIGILGGVLAWRLTVGAIGLAEANDQTTILGVPTWWAVALMVPSFALFGLTGFYTAWRHWRSVRADAGEDADAGSA
jgi:TRAP-type C4-dicarboxylate transport system permease small subunit